MKSDDYFLSSEADEADLSAWSSIIPPAARTLRTNLFGDVFIVDEGGAVHMLERAACAVQRIASSEAEFWHQIENDAEGWQLRPVADACRRAGKLLTAGQCYGFTTLPALGGDYTVENIWIAPWRDWFSFTAAVFDQIKDLPDGATVRLTIVD